MRLGNIKLKNQKFYLEIKEGDLIDPHDLADKLESSIVIFERLIQGKPQDRVSYEAVKSELESLKRRLTGEPQDGEANVE